MNRPDAIFYSLAFYSYLISFLLYIVHVALKKETLGRIATVISGIGLVPHSIAFGTRWAAQGHIPLANMYEYMGLMSWMVVAGLVYFVLRYKNHRIGVFVSPIAVMMLVVASLLPNEVNRQLMPALQSTWLAIHVTLAALGSGAFLISFAAGTLFLMSDEDGSSIKRETIQREWNLFAIFWIGLPLVLALVLRGLNLLPPSIDQLGAGAMGRDSGAALTRFALYASDGPLYWGRMAIGMGIGMVVAALVWPLAHIRMLRQSKREGAGAKMFMSVVFALLLSAVIVGFLIKSGSIALTGGSYFKIFEFFGPVLVISWAVAPIIWFLLGRVQGGWAKSIGVKRTVFEDIGYAGIAIGYPLYTVGALFAGAIWAEQAWGNWWSWDPKEVGALIIWLFYTGYLHARYQREWKGNRAAILQVLGMVFVFISFFGNYFFGGLHSFEVT